MPDEVEAFLRREELQRDRHQLDDLVEVARARRPHERLQFREGLFDRIEVRTVRWQKAEPGPRAFDRGLDLRLFVHREVVQHDDVTRAQRGHQHLLDVGEKRRIVDRPIEDSRGRELVDTQPRDDSVGLPMAVRRVIPQTLAAGTAPVAPQQVGGDTGFVDEDVAARVVQRLGVLPVATGGRDVRPSLLVGVYRFF
jgi:hypothetical protein